MAITATDDDIDHNQWNHPDEHDDNHERTCTCGPHASVDLTRAFRTRSESSSPSTSSLGSLREQLWDACRRQGCFHVTVNVSQLDRHTSTTAPSQEEGILSSLAGSVPSIHDDIHDMMSLGVAYGGGPHRNTTRNHPEDDSIHDGAATIAATYRGRTAESGAAGGTRTNHPSLVVAAAAAATVAEPKQSWEMRRCTGGCHSPPPPQETMGPNRRNEPAALTTGVNHDLEESSLGLLAQQKLVDWTHDLHQVATVLMELLFLETKMIHVPPASTTTTTTTTHQQQHPPLQTEEDHQTTVTQNVWLEPQPCAAMKSCQQIHNPLSSSSSSLLNASSKPEERTTCCNVDLLRAFCYDAVELDTTTDDDNDDHRTNDKDDHDTRGLVLGSSPHTDWGTLTVVWQDCKGGLQTYCHAHDQWTNVEVVVPTSTTPTTNHTTTTTTDATTPIGTTHADESSHPTTTNDTSGDPSTSRRCPQEEEEDTIVSLFVHVGDFTSLATRGAWPSPRHRVLCPMTTRPSRTTSSHANDDTTRENSVLWNERDSPYDHRDSENNDAREACRCSLVYFAYPPPGVTLAMAQDAFQQQLLVWNSNNNNSNNSHINANENDIPFSHYSVLQNQSNNAYYPTQNMEQIMYQRIQSIPFDQVIQDKWNQVQRTL